MSDYTTEQSDLFWEPFASQWQQLGFSGPNEVYGTYGKLFPAYNPHEENMLFEQVGAETSGELAAYNLMNASETARLAANTENRQNISELGLSDLDRSKKVGAEIHSLKKDSVVKAAIESIDKAKSASGKSGLSSGTAMSSMDMAIDTVKSKINASNASQAFSRKKNKQSVEVLKANTGYMDGDTWVEGSKGQLAELQSSVGLGLQSLKLGNRADIRAFDTEVKAANMHEAWQQDILQSVGALFRQDVRGDLARECDDQGGTWDPTTSSCDGAQTPSQTCEELCIENGGNANECWQDCEEAWQQGNEGDAGSDFDQGEGWTDTGIDEGNEGGSEWGGGEEEFEFDEFDPSGYNDGHS